MNDLLKKPFLQALKLATQLYELEDNDSPEADAIRDAIDGPWESMKAAQKGLFRQVLGALAKEKKA